jgi:hypothetical protein
MNKSICIAGQGRSYKRIEEVSNLFNEIILCNYDANFISQLNDNIVNLLKDKECILFCNASKSGFNNLAFESFNVKKCVVNRVKPTKNWKLWRDHKSKQTKGPMYTAEGIPKVIKDLPYMYRWRGPGPIDPTNGQPVAQQNVNYPEMKLSNGFKVNHISEDVEQYLIEPTNDRLETNMGLYFTALYSIVELKKTHLYYIGIDFYDTLNDGEAWKYHNYDRLRMEGEHMKILADKYLARYFPDVTFTFYTNADFNPTSENVKVIKEES